MKNTTKPKNPLRKRILRDIHKEKGKYISIFLFLTLMISMVSGMLISSQSMMQAYDEGIEKYNLESGHFATYACASLEALQSVADSMDTKADIYEQYFYNIDFAIDGNNDYSIRIYKNRTNINSYSIFDGSEPKKDSEIAIDRLFAENNKLSVGDTITVDKKKLTICGTVSVPDYSCLYENNSDSLFNASTFTVGFVTDDYFNEFNKNKLTYSYAYLFKDRSMNDKQSYNAGTKLMKQINQELNSSGNYLTDFLKRQDNKAITFTRSDMDGDSTSTIFLLYIIVALLAFIFALMTLSSIESEASAIGTLRASGYTRNELIRHYMVAPVIILLIAAIIGNILGYTYLQKVMAGFYYHSYSLPVYRVVWNANAFLLTTIIPIGILLAINFIALYAKLKLSPLQFIRHEMSTVKKKSVPKLPDFKFFTRFRLRTILQNIPNYITMGIGIFMANILFLYCASFLPILDNHTENVLNKLIAQYQYILNYPVEVDNTNAERFCMNELSDEGDSEVVIYGIADDSQYITTVDMPDNVGDVIVSKQYMKLHGYKNGDTITLHEKYGDNTYSFTITGSYDYPAAMSLFMSIDNYNKILDKETDYYTGYFCDELIDGLSEDMVYNIMGPDEYSNLSTQMKDSFGLMLPFMKYLSLTIFILVIYLLSKIVLEKNATAISLTKILGYNNSEISSIYIIATAIAVIINIAISIPLCLLIIKLIFQYMFMHYDIWIQVYINPSIFVQMVLWDILCYALLSALQFIRIRKIPMEEVLKNVE